MTGWPSSVPDLIELQLELATEHQPPWRLSGPARIGGCFVCFQRGSAGPGHTGDRGWAAAAYAGASAVVEGVAGAAYRPGLLALREGSLLEQAVRELPEPPDVLLVDATGRDHPRRAGLALHLGAVLGLATVGVTHRPLLATGEWPEDQAGAHSPLLLEGETVGYWVRTRATRRPLAVHSAWRTNAETAVQVVLASLAGMRTPQPLRDARCTARSARAIIDPRRRAI
ncbi:MAG: endonuclease V [Gaiellaceae bacterium]